MAGIKMCGDVWPTASELDAIAPNNPVYLTAKSLHASLGKHRRAETGEHHRRKHLTLKTDRSSAMRNGNATGVLLETAMELVGE